MEVSAGAHGCIKHWLIQPNPRDSKEASASNPRTTYRRAKHFLLSHAPAILIAFSVMIPVQATAGVFSFVSSLLSKNADAHQAPQVSENAQTVALLSAPLNADLEKARGGGDITIVGDSALLPESGPSGTLADIGEGSSRTAHGQISVYVVREGDTLSQIATMFGVSTNTIIWANDIERGSLIAPGETLVILPVSGVRHTVEKGDTLRSIAKKYDGNLEEIVEFNGIGADAKLAVDDVITIPDGVIESSAPVSHTHTAVRAGTAAPSYSGYYLRPVRGGVKTQGIHGYNGVDIAAAVGTPIMAAADGQVIISKQGSWNGGYGTYVVVKHDNGTQTLYAHNSSNIVSVGQWVVQGQVIGYMGSTGRSTGSHLHFEVRGAQNPF